MSAEEPTATEAERFKRWAQAKDGVEPAPIVAAATVILLRDGVDGLETLMLRRDSRLAFAGGMWVFPGGRVDPGDFAGDETDLVAAGRNAAVREAAEEAGLVVSVDSLVAFAHWTPPPEAPKRFSTQFYVAPAPSGAVTIDDGEIRDHMWVSPAEGIRRRDALEIELAPPTWVTLHTLNSYDTVDAAIEGTRRRGDRALHHQGCVHRRRRRGDVARRRGLRGRRCGPTKGRATASGWSTPGWRYERTPL